MIRNKSHNKIDQTVIIILLLLVLLVQPGLTQILSTDARMMSLGEAFHSLSDDVDSVSYNPAGLTHLKNIMFSCSYLPVWDSLTTVYFFGFAYPQETIPFGIGFFNASTDGILIRADSPEVLRKTRYQDISLFLAGGYAIVPGMSLGLRLNMNYLKIVNYDHFRLGTDLAFLWRMENPYGFTKSKILRALKPFSLGVTLNNLFSTPLKLKQTSETDPLNIFSSLSYRFKRIGRFIEPELGLGFDLVPEYSESSINAGLELILWKVLFLRSAYKFREGSFTLGTGFRAWDIKLDLALSNLEIDQNFYSFSIKVNF
ncbi:MAG: hypothetical protein JW827_03150 [Spirochaetes bacterium]|nr:hypothetical protein [Spirochaetota bacterium]